MRTNYTLISKKEYNGEVVALTFEGTNIFTMREIQQDLTKIGYSCELKQHVTTTLPQDIT